MTCPADGVFMSHGAISQLEAEWKLIVRRPATLANWVAVTDDEPSLRRFHSPDELVRWLRSTDWATAVPVFDALVWQAVRHDLALRTTLEALVPLMSNQLRWMIRWIRRSGSGYDLQEAEQCVLAFAVIAITQVAARGKPWCGARITSSLRGQLKRYTAHEYAYVRRERTSVGLGHLNLAGPQVEPSIDSRERFARLAAQHNVLARDIELLWLTRVAGFEPADLVERLGSSRDTLLRRRHRAERRLAASLGQPDDLIDAA